MRKRTLEILHALRLHVHVLTWVKQVVKEYHVFLLGMLALNIAVTLSGISFSVLVKHLIDSASRPHLELRLLHYAALMLGWTALSGLLFYVTRVYYEKVLLHVREKIFHAVLGADWLGISATPVGDLSSRLSRDTAEVTEFACHTFPGLVGALLQLALTAFIVFRINRKILLLLLVGAVLSAVIMLGFRLYLKPLARELRERDADLSAYQTELFTNLLVVKSSNIEEESAQRYSSIQEARFSALRRKEHFSYSGSMVLNLFFDAGYLLVFSWAVLNLGRGKISYGMLSMLIALEGYIQGPINSIASALPNFVRMLVSADRLNELTAMADTADAEEAGGQAGLPLGIEVEGLRFTYPGREPAVLDGLSFRVSPGSFTVLTGSSGCGKTTLLMLLLGLIHPQAGSLSFPETGGGSLCPGRAARRRTGYVPQGNTLFSGSILDNVCLFGEVRDEAAAREALRIADALSFVDALPDGLHSRLGEKNEGLSVGQAQRIAIARALYMRPDLLLLDEATSALDRKTELRILDAICHMPERPTVLCVSHREQALQYADQILRLDETGIAEVKAC